MGWREMEHIYIERGAKEQRQRVHVSPNVVCRSIRDIRPEEALAKPEGSQLLVTSGHRWRLPNMAASTRQKGGGTVTKRRPPRPQSLLSVHPVVRGKRERVVIVAVSLSERAVSRLPLRAIDSRESYVKLSFWFLIGAVNPHRHADSVRYEYLSTCVPRRYDFV